MLVNDHIHFVMKENSYINHYEYIRFMNFINEDSCMVDCGSL